MNNASSMEIFLFDILVHIFILYIVLYILFFAVISQTEKQSFNTVIKTATDTLPNNVYPKLGANFCIGVQNEIDNLTSMEAYYNSGPDKTEKDFNNLLISASGIVVLFLFFSVLIAYLITRYSSRKYLNLKHVIGTNISLFALIGCVEILFFFNVAEKYVPVLPSDFEVIAYNSMKNVLN